MEASNDIVRWFGLEVNIRIMIMTWIVMAVLIVFACLASRKIRWIPKGWQNVFEFVVEFIQNMIRENVGPAGLKYTYFFSSLFLFILVSNLLGLIPGLQSPTRDVSVTLSLALVWTAFLQYVSIHENGFKGFVKHYLEPFPPFIFIHILDLITRPLTLALRLFGNIFAGEILIEKLTENFHIILPWLGIALGLIIGGIQAFIFTVLTVSYTGLSVSHEDSSHSGASEHSH
jgi:F-type H+-transporting ATPase subunit a